MLRINNIKIFEDILDEDVLKIALEKLKLKVDKFENILSHTEADMLLENTDVILPKKRNYYIEKYEGECVGFIKDISIICKRLKCPIIFVYYGNFRRIKSYVDKIIITTDKEPQNRNIELRSI